MPSPNLVKIGSDDDEAKVVPKPMLYFETFMIKITT